MPKTRVLHRGRESSRLCSLRPALERHLTGMIQLWTWAPRAKRQSSTNARPSARAIARVLDDARRAAVGNPCAVVTARSVASDRASSRSASVERRMQPIAMRIRRSLCRLAATNCRLLEARRRPLPGHPFRRLSPARDTSPPRVSRSGVPSFFMILGGSGSRHPRAMGRGARHMRCTTPCRRRH